MCIPPVKGFSISPWMEIAHPFLMPPPGSKPSLTPLLVTATTPIGSKRDFWASSKFQNSPSQMPCLFQPSRHRLPYSKQQAFPGRFFFKQVKWLVISPTVPRLKFLLVVLSSRPSGVLFFQNA